MIRERAYELWVGNGSPEGQSEVNWITAEQEILAGERRSRHQLLPARKRPRRPRKRPPKLVSALLSAPDHAKPVRRRCRKTKQAASNARWSPPEADCGARQPKFCGGVVTKDLIVRPAVQTALRRRACRDRFYANASSVAVYKVGSPEDGRFNEAEQAAASAPQRGELATCSRLSMVRGEGAIGKHN